MKLLVLRHGRTFAPGTQAVWIGAHENPPLTAEGLAQAQVLGAKLRGAASQLVWASASPMARTQAHARAALAAAGAHMPVHADEVLRELDYGAWSGRSRAQIESDGGAAAVNAWETDGSYPDGVGFAPARELVLQALSAWLQQTRDKLRGGDGWALAVTHGGILRLLTALLRPRQLQNTSAGPSPVLGKVACGHGCLIDMAARAPQVLAWNAAPDDDVWQTLSPDGAGSTLAHDA